MEKYGVTTESLAIIGLIGLAIVAALTDQKELALAVGSGLIGYLKGSDKTG